MGIDRDILVVGAGVFGLTAALELTARGHHVTLLDPGPLPSPLAASTDVSKVVRIEYGGDTRYERLAERARIGWLRWNAACSGEALYHEVGATFLTSRPLAPGGYEYENYQSLRMRGHAPERLTAIEIRERLPAWNAAIYIDGYFTDKAGYVESRRAMEWLTSRIDQNAPPLLDRAEALVVEAGRVVGVRTQSHGEVRADQTVVAMGAWTPLLVPDLGTALRSVGQPIFYLRPEDPTLFSPPHFFVFGADSARTGWYGFPVHPRTGVLKIANHGPGTPLHPDDARVVSAREINALRRFLHKSIPWLAAAPLAGVRCCLYCDTPDEHFLIGRHPDLAGLTVAAGDSGHAFKFAPVLGELVADAVEGRDNPEGRRFAWRSFEESATGGEASRFRGNEPRRVEMPATVDLRR